jgi:hypothetical protein
MTAASRARRLLGAALFAVVAVASGDASADPTPEERVAARALFDDGRALMKNQHYTEACPKLEESQRLDPGIGTLYNIADCYEGIGRVASAWTTFLDVAEASRRAGEAERAAVAKGRADALAPQLPRVRVTAEQRAGLTLTLDGKAFAAALIETAVPVDPGKHLLGADAPGKKHWELRFSASLASNVSVAVPPLMDAPVVLAPVPVTPAATPPPAPAQPSPNETARWHVPVAIAAAGLGVVGIVVGSVSGGAAVSDWSSAKPDCPNDRCTTSAAYASWHDAHTAGIISTASFVVGGALVAAGAVVWFTRPSAPAALGLRSDGAVMVAGRFP